MPETQDELTILREMRESWIRFGNDDIRYLAYRAGAPSDKIVMSYCEWLRLDRDLLLNTMEEIGYHVRMWIG
jgi:hypothetical protein